MLRGGFYVDSSRNVYYANNDGLLSGLSGNPNEAQQAIVAAARTTSAAAYGSKWVSNVYQNAGLGTFIGNAWGHLLIFWRVGTHPLEERAVP